MKHDRLTLIEVLVVIALLCILVAILVPAVLRNKEAALRASCADNLKQIWTAFKMYADEHRGKFPPIGDRRNNLIVDANLLVPKYLSVDSLHVFHCPSREGDSPTSADDVTDESYFYLGWVVQNEDQGLAGMDAYETLDWGKQGLNLQVAKNQGFAGTSTLFRFREMKHWGWGFPARPDDPVAMAKRAMGIKAYNESLIMWERPGSHRSVGGNVLGLDGHVEWVEYPDKFPMTPAFIERLEEISARK